jgi:hypothetical protein
MRRKKKSSTHDILTLVMTDFFMGVSGMALGMFIVVALAVNDTESPGSLEVMTLWDAEVNKDIDTWGRIEGRSWVGFNSAGDGEGLTLVYDDKGHDGHRVRRNFENMYARELIPGKWTVNIHYYANKERGPDAEDVNVMIRVKERGASTFKELVNETITLTRVHEEVTVCTFEISDDGKVVEGSVKLQPPTEFRVKPRNF